MTLCDSTKLTSNSHLNCPTKRMRTSMPNHSSSALKEVGEQTSELMFQSQSAQPEDPVSQAVQADETLMDALKLSCYAGRIVGVSPRKVKSLKFREKRRKMKL